MPDIFKTFQECQHYLDTNFFEKIKYDLKGHARS